MSKSIQFKCGKEENAYVHPFWPIGSIYLSLDETNPSKWFGGTWERIKDRFILACGDTYANGATGGEATHKLTIDEMPSHNHGVTIWHQWGSGGYRFAGGNNAISEAVSTDYKGGNQAHNNMPPYLAVYVWKRVA